MAASPTEVSLAGIPMGARDPVGVTPAWFHIWTSQESLLEVPADLTRVTPPRSPIWTAQEGFVGLPTDPIRVIPARFPTGASLP